jgi:hypothetical protein
MGDMEKFINGHMQIGFYCGFISLKVGIAVRNLQKSSQHEIHLNMWENLWTKKKNLFIVILQKVCYE